MMDDVIEPRGSWAADQELASKFAEGCSSDPHVTHVTGEKFDLIRTGWSAESQGCATQLYAETHCLRKRLAP